uniref:Uncharacterized protein n=1 Tax=Panagrolaimus davidi TaxID=227884 RepID=A0A914P6W9_9BILA
MTTFDNLPDRLRHRIKIKNELLRNTLCEFICTTIFVFGGTSIWATYILGRGQYNEWLGLTFGAHLNPAVSLFLATFKSITFIQMFFYWLAQFFASFFGAALTYLMYYDAINNFDGGIRYVTGHRSTAKIFSTYPTENLSVFGGFFDQLIGTAILCFFIAGITDRRNKIPLSFQPTLIGISFMLIGLAWGMNSGYSLNPARDFGPRIFTLFAGYGWKVFSFRNYKWFWIPIFAPLIGGPLGAWIYQFSIGFHIPSELDEIEEEFRRIQDNKMHQTVILQDSETITPQSSTHQNVHRF